MRNVLASLLILVAVVVILIPALMVRGCTTGGSNLKHSGSAIKVFNHLDNRVQKMEMEEYLKGVVAAEMPVSFEVEALKAQAVLARTYVVRRIKKGISVPDHPEAVISTDFQNGQAWVSKKELQKKWGFFNYFKNWRKISQAVDQTAGQVLTYNNELAEALYHSNAGGQTEDAANVWGNSVPYLKSVSSPYDTEASNFKREFTFTWSELDKRLKSNMVKMIINAEKSGTPVYGNSLVEILEKSSGQRILQIRFGGQIYSGKEFRSALTLPTTKCEITVEPKGLKFTTYGNGHGVGMSQYGANGMAKRGSKYLEIIQHYFPGTRLGKMG